jgi:hypothetical protein
LIIDDIPDLRAERICETILFYVFYVSVQWVYDTCQKRNLMRVESEHAPLLALGVCVGSYFSI